MCANAPRSGRPGSCASFPPHDLSAQGTMRLGPGVQVLRLDVPQVCRVEVDDVGPPPSRPLEVDRERGQAGGNPTSVFLALRARLR